MTPCVSVIIPTYKRSDYLERAIESVLKQSYQAIEIVVVDDNAPDSYVRAETEAKMLAYENDSRVTYNRNETNLGGALARNEGVARASGDYITFLDDDDIYLPEKITRQVHYMEENGLDLSFTDVRIHDTADTLVDFRHHPYVTNLANDELLKNHLLHHLTPTASYMFKKEALHTIGGFDNVAMGQEFMLMLKAIEQGLTIGYLPEANVIQYIHDGERISVGANKLAKERELFAFKQTYFPQLSRAERRYVTFRHHAVMAVAGKRSGYMRITATHLLKALVTSPYNCVRELVSHTRKLRQGNG
ncbi:hypothetical protein GCM10028778_15640 [Barrientosiimonas marina]|uniref:Glycosyltransferase family 2 protein n=1 Tax=Lentibacillus kimchii TaxID=1542911 RepID=A0ABW2UW04_9BACI